MKINRLRLWSIPLVFSLLVIFLFSSFAYAEDVSCQGREAEASILGGVCDIVDSTVISADSQLVDDSCFASDLKSLEDQLRQALINREKKFTVYYLESWDEAVKIIDDSDQIIEDIFNYDSPDTSSDYDYLDYTTDTMQVEMTEIDNGVIVEFTMQYLTTAEQEEFVDLAVERIMAKLNLDDASQYEKVKAIHDYIVEYVDYDDDLEKYSAYDALSSGETVCLGYALLTYKMMAEAGVPVKIISGESYGEGHAWNIIGIGDYWYNLDTTWDDTANTNKYFLRGENRFSSHERDDRYLTDEFEDQYPMSSSNFSLEDDISYVTRITLSCDNAGLFAGNKLQLTADIGPVGATEQVLIWSSSDKNVATVDENGLVTAHNLGSADILAISTDGGAVSASCSITVFDLSSASSWSKSEINSLYQRNVIPTEILSNFSSGINRAEFTALMVNIYQYAKGDYVLKGVTPFTDTAGNIYEEEIAKGYELGIINGIDVDTFDTEGTLTREQCAKIIAVTAGLINGDSLEEETELPFLDISKISSWAIPYVKNAYIKGLMTGTGSGFSPKSYLTREQALVIAERMIMKYSW